MSHLSQFPSYTSGQYPVSQNKLQPIPVMNNYEITFAEGILFLPQAMSG